MAGNRRSRVRPDALYPGAQLFLFGWVAWHHPPYMYLHQARGITETGNQRQLPVMPPGCLFFGKTLVELRFKSRYQVETIAVQTGEQGGSFHFTGQGLLLLAKDILVVLGRVQELIALPGGG